MRQADHRHLRDLGHAIDRFFNLPARHVFAAGLDHVLLAINHREVTLVIEHREVATVEPPALERRAGALRVVEVTRQ